MFSNVEKRPLTPSSADPSKKYLPINCILKYRLNRLRNTKTGSDKWARRVLLEIHFCTLSRVYQEQRTEFGYILYVLKAVFLLVVSPGGLCAVLPGGRAVCPRWNPGTHWGGDVDCSGVVQQSVCWAEFMWRDWEWSSFVTPDQVLILPCSLRQEGAVLTQSCGCTWGCFKRGKCQLWFFSTCVLHCGMVMWDTVCHYLHSALFQGAALHVSLWELGY